MRILVVDDDRFFRELLTSILERHGHQVLAMGDGSTALATFRPGEFDVVISDLVMPGIDGLGLMERLRQVDPEQEVLLATGASDVRAAVNAIRAGAADVLVKPIDEATLLLSVERCNSRLQLRKERTRLLDENLEFIKHHALYRRCLELLSTLDLERLQETALADLAAVCDAQSGALWVADDRGDLQLRAYRGLVNRARLAVKIDPRQGGYAPGISARVPFHLAEDAKELYVPLWAAGDLVALVYLGDKLSGGFSADDRAISRAVGDFAATALRNARRFVALERLGLRDRETSAYNLAYFVDYAGKEAYKARRYNRSFSLLTLSVDNLAALRADFAAEDVRHAMRGVVAAMSQVCRDADVIAKSSESELYVLLPETDLFGGMMFARRAQAAIHEDKAVGEMEARTPLSLAFGVSTFPKDGDDFDELVHRCRQRLEESRHSLHRRLMLEPLDFWSAVDLLVGGPRAATLPLDDRGGASRRTPISEQVFRHAQVEAARELARDPQARGLLYLGLPELRPGLPVLEPLENLTDSQSRAYLLGRRAGLDTHPTATLVYPDGDERIQQHEFLILHSEHSSYALLRRRGDGESGGFHSSDTLLVDGLVHKLQEAYDLQPF